MTLLLSTVLLLARLHRSSVATALVTDAARSIAEQADRGGAGRARVEAERRLARLLGPDALVTWQIDETTVRVEVRLPAPPLPGLGSSIRRGAEIRREQAP